MNNRKPISYTIQRIGQKNAEEIRADNCARAGTPESYVFSLNGSEVERIFVTAIEKEPSPNYPRTAEERKAWRELAEKSKLTTRRLIR